MKVVRWLAILLPQVDKKCETIPPTALYNWIPATENIEKASLFKKYFFSVFTKSNFELPASSYQFDPTARHHLLSIQVSDHEKEILDTPISLHTDIDCIGPKILKQCAYILAKPLSQSA